MRPLTTDVALLACAAACGGPLPPAVDLSSDAGSADVALETAQDASAVDAGICCQITHDFTTDPYWQNCRFPCSVDGDGVIPWVCKAPAPTSCTDPACVVGSSCVGFNGTGLVVACDDPVVRETVTRLTSVTSLCPM